jgi:cyclic beta-1,2-glucan synthetase
MSCFTKLSKERRDASVTLNQGFARDEAFDARQLERRAAEVAAGHEVLVEHGPDGLFPSRLLVSSHSLLTTFPAFVAAHGSAEISPAAQRLANNFHLVEEQLQIIGRRLTNRYYHDLPKLSGGALAGYPRIYGVALSLIAHTNDRLGAETLACFLQAYQRTAPLSMREVRAFELTLRIVLMEKLSRVAACIVGAQAEREEADALADHLLELVGRRPLTETFDVLFTRLEEMDQPGHALVARLACRLRGRNSGALAALDWLEKSLQGEGLSTEQVVRMEHERQSSMSVEVDNIIIGMISLSTLNWHDFFESVSVVDAVLAEDPDGFYLSTDFETQESYRRVVERVAKRTQASEVEVARRALRLALGARQADQRERAHVGYYLVDDGLQKLEKALNYRGGLAERAARVVLHRPTSLYLFPLAAMSAVLVFACVLYARRNGASLLMLVGVAVLSLLPASEIASVGLRPTLMRVFRPRLLPRMDTSLGLPDGATTMVVVSAIFSSSETVRESLETIEAHYLSNQDGNIFFALLGDWNAAPQEKMPDDCALLAAAASGVKELNAWYNDGPEDRFYLFHRRRLWNQSEGEWIGWEGKRGKLREFNRLIRGVRKTSYTTCTADPAFLKRIRFVISLDSDTELPRDAARKLVGTILHPLNRPRLDADTGHVTHGYGILQPLFSSPRPKARQSRIPRILSGDVCINPGTNLDAAAVPDVYQDLFGEGNYLYEVDTFEAALKDRVPENTLLSHHLERLRARAALVTDVEIFDHSPTDYLVHSRRAHHWTRGDWQLLPWLLPRVRGERGKYVRNVLPVIGRWKIIDNLRHSLIKPAILLWLFAAWTTLPGAPASWTKIILLIFTAPFYLHFTIELLVQASGRRQAAIPAKAWAAVKISTSEALSSTVYLAHQAYLMTDAITRTLYRTVMSRKHLLEWDTAEQTSKESTMGPRLFIRYMWPAPVIALAGVALLAAKAAPALRSAAPLLLAWLASPLFACWRSRRLRLRFEALEENVARDVHLNARCTLRFLETSLAHTHARSGPQTAPKRVAALDSSLANLGRLLLWRMSAYELGATGRLELVERLESTLAAMENLRVLHGLRSNPGTAHPFGMTAPQHVLISEAGNLAGFLQTLKQRCIKLSCQPLFDDHVVCGVNDTLLLMKKEFLSINTVALRREGRVMLDQLKEEMKMCLAFVRAAGREEAPQTTTAWRTFFNIMIQRAAVIEFMLSSFSQKYPTIKVDGLSSWTGYLRRQAQELSRELYVFAPWTSVRTAHMAPIIRRQSGRALARWNCIVEGLDRPSAISGPPEELYGLLVELEGLCRQLDPSLPPDTAERETVLKGCDELRDAIQGALRASNDARSRYASLANRCQAVVEATEFRPLFDQEYRLSRSQFQVSMVG